jgi:hypothetical protein
MKQHERINMQLNNSTKLMLRINISLTIPFHQNRSRMLNISIRGFKLGM